MKAARKQIDTTDESAYEGTRPLTSHPHSERVTHLADQFRIHMCGMYFSEIGPTWDSGGKRQSDYLHHIDIGISGQRQVGHDGKLYTLKPGQIWFLPGNTPVERRCDQRCEVLFFKLNCELLPGVDPLLDWPNRGPRLADTCDPEEWRKWQSPRREIGMIDLLQLRAQLLTWMTAAIPELGLIVSRHLEITAQFTAVFDMIEKSLGADLRLPSLAAVCGKTPEAFSMSFIRSTGISPKDYVMRRLNQEALKLVLNTDINIKEISQKLRFTDEFYFSRFFKNMNDCSPSAYRKQFRDGRAEF